MSPTRSNVKEREAQRELKRPLGDDLAQRRKPRHQVGGAGLVQGPTTKEGSEQTQILGPNNLGGIPQPKGQ